MTLPVYHQDEGELSYFSFENDVHLKDERVINNVKHLAAIIVYNPDSFTHKVIWYPKQ